MSKQDVEQLELQELLENAAPQPVAEIGKTAGSHTARSIAVKRREIYKVKIDRIVIREGFNFRVKPDYMDEEEWLEFNEIRKLADGIYLSGGPEDPLKGDLMEDGTIVLMEGWRRTTAIRLLLADGKEFYPNGERIDEVEVDFNEKGTTDLDRYRSMGNQTKKALTPIQWGLAFIRLKSKPHEMTSEQIAELYGNIFSRQHVDNMILLTKLPAETRRQIDYGEVKPTNALNEYRAKRSAEKETAKQQQAAQNQGNGQPPAQPTIKDPLSQKTQDRIERLKEKYFGRGQDDNETLYEIPEHAIRIENITAGGSQTPGAPFLMGKCQVPDAETTIEHGDIIYLPGDEEMVMVLRADNPSEVMPLIYMVNMDPLNPNYRIIVNHTETDMFLVKREYFIDWKLAQKGQSESEIWSINDNVIVENDGNLHFTAEFNTDDPKVGDKIYLVDHKAYLIIESIESTGGTSNEFDVAARPEIAKFEPTLFRHTRMVHVFGEQDPGEGEGGEEEKDSNSFEPTENTLYCLMDNVELNDVYQYEFPVEKEMPGLQIIDGDKIYLPEQQEYLVILAIAPNSNTPDTWDITAKPENTRFRETLSTQTRMEYVLVDSAARQEKIKSQEKELESRLTSSTHKDPPPPPVVKGGDSLPEIDASKEKETCEMNLNEIISNSDKVAARLANVPMPEQHRNDMVRLLEFISKRAVETRELVQKFPDKR